MHRVINEKEMLLRKSREMEICTTKKKFYLFET